MLSPGQMLMFRFPPGANFEGGLVGALERMESGGALRVHGMLFVGRDPETGELVATMVRGRQGGSFVAPLLNLRLDPAERARLTRRALREFEREAEPNPLVALAETLEPGAAVATVLVEHVWARALTDAVDRTGGMPVLSEPAAATHLADVSAALLAAMARTREQSQ
jgi:hypothetical protein